MRIPGLIDYFDRFYTITFVIFGLFCRIGIVTGIFGLVSTLVPMYTFADACLTELQPGFRYHNVTINSKLGTAFYLLLVATLLKVVDVLAHFLVPVPDKGYWEPSAAAGKANVTKEISLTELTEQKWEKCSVEVGVDASSEGTKTQPSYSKI